MSLSYRQRKSLRRTERAIRCADPGLAQMMSAFALLVLDEDMPGHESIQRPLARIGAALLAAAAMLTCLGTYLLSASLRGARVTAAVLWRGLSGGQAGSCAVFHGWGSLMMPGAHRRS